MSFTMDFVIEFSSFRVDPKLDKYLSNAFDLILLTWYNKTSGLEIENKNEEDIENPGPYSPLFKEGLQHPPSIFDRYIFRS